MAADAFLKFGTRAGSSKQLVGESSDTKYKSWFQFDSCGFGITNTGTISSQSSGAGGGIANFEKFNFSKKLDSSSPVLWECVAMGSHIAEAWLMIRKAGGTTPYCKFYFKNCYISGLTWSGGDETATESVTFDFGGMVVTYFTQDSKTGAIDTTAYTGAYSKQEGTTELTAAADP